MKNCIACDEEIKSAALLCKHCGTKQDDPSYLVEAEPALEEKNQLKILQSVDADKASADDGSKPEPLTSNESFDCPICRTWQSKSWKYCDNCGYRFDVPSVSITAAKDNSGDDSSPGLGEVGPSKFPKRLGKAGLTVLGVIVLTAISVAVLNPFGFIIADSENAATNDDASKTNSESFYELSPEEMQTVAEENSELIGRVLKSAIVKITGDYVADEGCADVCSRISVKLEFRSDELYELNKLFLGGQFSIVDSRDKRVLLQAPILSLSTLKVFEQVTLESFYIPDANLSAKIQIGPSDERDIDAYLSARALSIYGFAFLQQEGKILDSSNKLPRSVKLFHSLIASGFCKNSTIEVYESETGCTGDLGGEPYSLLVANTEGQMTRQIASTADSPEQIVFVGSGWSFIAEGMTLSPRILYEVKKMGTFVVLGGPSLCPALGFTVYMPMDTCFTHALSN